MVSVNASVVRRLARHGPLEFSLERNRDPVLDVRDTGRHPCGPFRFFWRILLPLSRPVLATVGVLALIGSWNAFLLPLVVLTEADNWTLPLGVTNYSTQYTADIARILAFTTLSMVPALVFYAFAERHLVAGLTSGAVKG